MDLTKGNQYCIIVEKASWGQYKNKEFQNDLHIFTLYKLLK